MRRLRKGPHLWVSEIHEWPQVAVEYSVHMHMLIYGFAQLGGERSNNKWNGFELDGWQGRRTDARLTDSLSIELELLKVLISKPGDVKSVWLVACSNSIFEASIKD